MGRPKKEDAEKVAPKQPESEITPLTIDFPSEGLNDMARKVNEIIKKLNG